MNYPDLDIGLTEDEQAIRDMIQRFGNEVVRPAGIRLDRLADPADVISPESELWDVHRAYRELGLHKFRLPPRYGGMAGQTSLNLNQGFWRWLRERHLQSERSELLLQSQHEFRDLKPDLFRNIILRGHFSVVLTNL